jgi:hypothetical protein
LEAISCRCCSAAALSSAGYSCIQWSVRQSTPSTLRKYSVHVVPYS